MSKIKQKTKEMREKSRDKTAEMYEKLHEIDTQADQAKTRILKLKKDSAKGIANYFDFSSQLDKITQNLDKIKETL